MHSTFPYVKHFPIMYNKQLYQNGGLTQHHCTVLYLYIYLYFMNA